MVRAETFKKGLPVARAFIRQLYLEQRRWLSQLKSKERVIVPWMKYREIEIIEDILTRLKPQRVLEWGSGYSTLYFQQFLGPDAHWLAVEHEKDWSEKVQAMNTDPRVEIVCIEPNHRPWTDQNCDASYQDMKDYVEYPNTKGPFDMVLIDGRARADCLVKAQELVGDRGVVILHDANRDFYHAPLPLFEHQILFDDSRTKEGGIWIGSDHLEMSEIMDLEKHQQVWKLYQGFGGARR